MVDSITLTRAGWIKHLATIQKMVALVGSLHRNVEMSFPEADCETDRSERIAKALLKLQELIWESGAVSERIHRERGEDDPDFDALDRDRMNRQTEGMRARFVGAAQKLEKEAARLTREEAPSPGGEDGQDEDGAAEYPGEFATPKEEEDPRQMRMELKPDEPPVILPSDIIDFKKKQANDDTTGGEE